MSTRTVRSRAHQGLLLAAKLGVCVWRVRVAYARHTCFACARLVYVDWVPVSRAVQELARLLLTKGLL